MSQNTIQLRQQNPEQTEKMAQFESPDGDDVCASYVDRALAGKLGEYAELTISEGDSASLDGVSGSGSGNYAIYETPGGAVTGLYISHDALAEVTGDEAIPENAPEAIGMSFAPSSEDEWEEAESVDEDEVDDLLSDSDESDDEPEAEAEDEADDLVEIDDEELDLEA
jgi:hypothetical protein